MKKFILSLLALPLLASAANIYMVGDSTMANYNQEKRGPLQGWGMQMQDLCAAKVKVFNRAISGSSSKSFLEQQNGKRWQWVMDRVKPGDFVIIQFGHNDARKIKGQNERITDANSTFQEYLKKYIEDVRAKGAIPVLCTQTMLCEFGKKTGKPYNRGTNASYIAATRKVAAETGCDLVDLNAYALKHFKEIGEAEAMKYYLCLKPGEFPAYPKGKTDRCHLQTAGAKFYAETFVKLAKEQNLPIAKLFK